LSGAFRRQTLFARRGDAGRETLFCLVFLAMAIYAVILFGTPHYNHWVMKGRVAEIVRQTPYSDEEIRAKLMEEIRSVGVPIPAEDVTIERTPKHNIIVSMSWTEDVQFLDYYLTSYDFSIRAGGDPQY